MRNKGFRLKNNGNIRFCLFSTRDSNNILIFNFRDIYGYKDKNNIYMQPGVVN